ncbi:serine/threonine-protein kinase [Actinosynnema sp. CS-041913]|uniref:serine/threonine-protein kinase n=1 Tax=Actinosynnema sp. CS-041913 TaxID=3239917 RepID=UPI003D8BDCFA
MGRPTAIGRYPVRRLLGAGGFAVVWLADDERLDDQVAIKVLAENWAERLDVRQRFEREAQALRRARSHRVIEVFDIGELPDGRPYFVMTYADRGSLADLLADGPLPVEEALRHGAELARGAADLHAAGLLHRDIKPSNVLFRSTAGRPRPLIADLGLSRDLARGSRFTLAAGTLGYMAPEQDDPDGVIDERVDVFGVGATVYHALTGRAPDEEVVAPSTLRSGLPDGTDAVLLRALAADPRLRWPTANDLATALDELAVNTPAEPPRGRPRTSAAVTAALLGVLVLVGVAVTQWPRWQSHNASTASAEARSTSAAQASSPVSAPKPPAGLPNCRHSEGNGDVVSANYVRDTTRPEVIFASVQLCRDAARRYWVYLVLHAPLDDGRWANGYLERWADDRPDAPVTCANPGGGATGHVLPGRTQCWSPKVDGADSRYTFLANAQVCTGAYDDVANCYGEGRTARKR